MRRRLIVVLALGLTLVLPQAPATAAPGDAAGAPAASGAPPTSGAPSTDPDGPVAPEEAEEALDAAERVLEGEAHPEDPSPTLALADLKESVVALGGRDRRQARAMLARPDDPAARPTDGGRDRFGDGYDRRSFQKCSRHFCVHYTKTGGDRRPDGAWVNRNLRVLERVWRHHVGKLGYRRPVRDGRRGGGGKFDVYLKNIGFQGYYGYCAPERRPNPGRRVASSYCVLDNDFSRSEFGVPPTDSLQVTAAHEFFHAIQFSYDTGEDPWLMEATATWVEERFADGINDNRQFLSAGQVAKPGRPLDLFNFSTRAPYGNWAFFEYLSARMGARVVRQILNRAGDFAGAPDQHSVQAVRTTLRSRKRSFSGIYARFAAANTIPGRSYPEGGAWPSAPVSSTYQLSGARTGTGPVTRRLRHLTSRNVDIGRQRTGFSDKRVLRVRVEAPPRATGSTAHAIVHLRNGRLSRRLLALDRRGDGVARLPFHGGVRKVTLTLANASTRYRCWRGTTWSCRGAPRDDNGGFTFAASAVRP